MTPDELERVQGWLKKYQGWFWWSFACAAMAGLCYILYKFPAAEIAAANHGHGKHSALVLCYIFLIAIPGLPVICTFVVMVVKLNARVARFRLRKQDSLARLTKRHEKMLIKIRELEREVSERTEDLPPETIPVTMRGDA